MKWSLAWDLLIGLWQSLTRRRLKKARGLRILLVEDDPMDAELATHALRRAGHVVDWAASEVDALALFFQHHHRLVFVDMGLAATDGWSLARTLSERNDGVRVWILTGSQDSLLRIMPGYALGVIIKSVRWEALVAAVRFSGF